MPYVSMREMLNKARKEKYAVGAFNIVNYLTAKAVVDAAEDLKSPVILQTSVKTVKQIGVRELMGLLMPIAENADIDVSIHLDHCTDVGFAKECIDAGWSSIMYDGSKLPLSENITNTKILKEYIGSKDITLEGEIGSIVGVEDDIVVSADESAYAKIEDCEKYLNETDIDAIAPAVGTAHGVYKGEIKLDYDLFSDINNISQVPLVLHGGTGLKNTMFKELIALGASKVNISTAIKIAYCQSMYKYMAEHGNENDPLKLDDYVYKKIYDLAYEHINFFTFHKGGISYE